MKALQSQCEDEGIKNVILNPLTMLDGKVQKLIMFLDQHVDPDNKTRLKEGVDGNLDEIGEQLIELERKIDLCRSSAAAEVGLDDDQVKMLEQNGLFYFRTPNRNEAKIKKFETVSGLVPFLLSDWSANRNRLGIIESEKNANCLYDVKARISKRKIPCYNCVI